MATFDKLSAEQRAIIELVLQRGKSYAELSDLLAMPESRVRELAGAALVSLSPVSAKRVEDDWRGQVADYVLGQQTGPESTATRGYLRRSEAARTWARSLLDSLDTLYEGGLPTIPDGDRAARRERAPRRREREEAPSPAEELSPEARAAVRRRRMLGAGLVAAGVLALVVLVWPIGVLTKDDDNGNSTTNAADTVPQPGGSKGVPAGIAIVASRDGRRQVIVQAASLPPNKPRQAYEVWLYNNPKDARSLGAQVTDQRGTFQGAGPLPDDYRRFQFIDVSREAIDQNRAHSGSSVLRGKIGNLKTPPGNAKKGQAVILGQVVLTPPKD
jgi:Anti-sigma-K factor rskA/Sigma-70, region 4